MPDRRHPHRGRQQVARRRRGAHRRRCHRAVRQPRRRREGADRVLADRGRPRALCRRAGGGRRREQPLLAEDALDLIEVDYDPLPAVVDPLAALDPAQPVLHEGLHSNVASDRSFRYGDPRARFRRRCAGASRSTIRYPRNSCTPIETYGVLAEYDAGRRRLRRAGEFHGAVQPACGDGARAESAGQSLPPAHAAGFRRQLRRQAGRVSLHRADGASPRVPAAAR